MQTLLHAAGGWSPASSRRPNGAHFTSCDPDYGRDEAFQREYAAAAADPQAWAAFRDRYLSGDEAAYQQAVSA